LALMPWASTAMAVMAVGGAVEQRGRGPGKASEDPPKTRRRFRREQLSEAGFSPARLNLRVQGDDAPPGGCLDNRFHETSAGCDGTEMDLEATMPVCVPPVDPQHVNRAVRHAAVCQPKA